MQYGAPMRRTQLYRHGLSLLGPTAALSVVLLTGIPQASAADSATRGAVRGIAYEGVNAYQAGDYATAKEKLEVAYSENKVPSLALWSARALEKNGLLVEAAERYLEATRLAPGDGDPAVQEAAKADAEQERNHLLPRIPQLVVKVRGALRDGLVVKINGAGYSVSLLGAKRPTNPGSVLVTADRGDSHAESTLELREGETKEVELELVPKSDAAPSRVETGPLAPAPLTTPESSSGTLKPTLIWGGFGLGAVGIGAGAITGVMAMGKADALRADYNCNSQNQCDPGGDAAKSDAQTLGLISTIGFGVGAVGIGLGVYGLLLDDGKTAPSTAMRNLEIEVAFQRVTLRGTF